MSTTNQAPEASTDGTESTAATEEGSRPSQYVSRADTEPTKDSEPATEPSTTEKGKLRLFVSLSDILHDSFICQSTLLYHN